MLLVLLWRGIGKGEPSSLLYLFLIFLHVSSYAEIERNESLFGSELVEKALFLIAIQLVVYAATIEVLMKVAPTKPLNELYMRGLSKFEFLFLLSTFAVFVLLNGQVLFSEGKTDYLADSNFNLKLTILGLVAYILCGEFGWQFKIKKYIFTVFGLGFAVVSTNIFEGRSLVYAYFGAYLMWKIYVDGYEKSKKPALFLVSAIAVGWMGSNFLRILRYVPFDQLLEINFSNVVHDIDWSGSEAHIYTYYISAIDYVRQGVYKPAAETIIRFLAFPFPSSVFTFKPIDITYNLAEILCKDQIVCSRSVPAMLYGEAYLNFGELYFIYPVFIAIAIYGIGLITRLVQMRYMLGAYSLALMYIARGWFDGAFVIFAMMALAGAFMNLIRSIAFKARAA